MPSGTTSYVKRINITNLRRYDYAFAIYYVCVLYYLGITIGFERVSYTFSEERLNPSVRDEVFIVKQNDQTSELTYDITIESFTGTATIRDFIAAGETDELFTPDLQRIAVNFQIIPDDLPEGIETFSFQLRNNDPATTFTNDPRETTISIFDTDGEFQARDGLHGKPQSFSTCLLISIHMTSFFGAAIYYNMTKNEVLKYSGLK